jgi:hypothetical protein
VLHRLVEQCGDYLVLVAAVLDHQGCNPEEVTHARGVGAFTGLLAVRLEGVGERLLEPVTESWLGRRCVGHERVSWDLASLVAVFRFISPGAP